MTLAADLQLDYQHIDGIETVTHTTGTGATTATVKALRVELKDLNIGSGGPAVVDASEVIWEVWQATLECALAIGETLTDSADDVWKIHEMRRVGNPADRSIAQKWVCACNKIP